MIKQEYYPEEAVNNAANRAFEEQQHQVKDVNLREELKPLWVACYFERRLTKIQV